MMICKICNHSNGNKPYIVREMMFGFRDEFEYLECSKCGCLQIVKPPDDLSKYHPNEYASFQAPPPVMSGNHFIKFYFKRKRLEYVLLGKSIIGRFLSKIYGAPEYIDWFRRAKLQLDYEILDVGCGTGELLLELRHEGFRNLSGVDPFINNDVIYPNGVKVVKRPLEEIEGQFDFIMLHHSFEHMPEPLLALKQLHNILKPNRFVLIRIPLASSFAWREYGVNWAQIDAPRHFFLHTLNSMNILASQAGFEIADVVFDSKEFQFWASEQYLRDIPLMDATSYCFNPEKSIFSQEQIAAFKAKARELNKMNDGDQACFYLYKS
jgi:SAM-dependent methyltransferase